MLCLIEPQVVHPGACFAHPVKHWLNIVVSIADQSLLHVASSLLPVLSVILLPHTTRVLSTSLQDHLEVYAHVDDVFPICCQRCYVGDETISPLWEEYVSLCTL